MDDTSPLRQLAEVKVSARGATLDEQVKRWRDAGIGWRPIAQLLSAEYEVIVDSRTLSRWFPEL